jgi:uroporphyrinogen-III synthase
LNAHAATALAGRRIVITRAPEQADEVARCLTNAGAQVSLLPMVRFVEAADTAELDRAIAMLDQFDWLIFTSANAVRFFLARCRAQNRWPGPTRPLCAVVGQATRTALEKQNLRAAFTPTESSAVALTAEMAGALTGKHVLVPRSNLAGDELVAALRSAGATVTAVVAYDTAMPESLDAAVLETIRHGDTDAVVFFSPSAFQFFSGTLGGEALHGLGGRVAFAAIGPTTAATIREAGVQAVVEAADASADSLVAALERYFTSRAGVTKERV